MDQMASLIARDTRTLCERPHGPSPSQPSGCTKSSVTPGNIERYKARWLCKARGHRPTKFSLRSPSTPRCAPSSPPPGPGPAARHHDCLPRHLKKSATPARLHPWQAHPLLQAQQGVRQASSPRAGTKPSRLSAKLGFVPGRRRPRSPPSVQARLPAHLRRRHPHRHPQDHLLRRHQAEAHGAFEARI